MNSKIKSIISNFTCYNDNLKSIKLNVINLDHFLCKETNFDNNHYVFLKDEIACNLFMNIYNCLKLNLFTDNNWKKVDKPDFLVNIKELNPNNVATAYTLMFISTIYDYKINRLTHESEELNLDMERYQRNMFINSIYIKNTSFLNTCKNLNLEVDDVDEELYDEYLQWDKKTFIRYNDFINNNEARIKLKLKLIKRNNKNNPDTDIDAVTPEDNYIKYDLDYEEEQEEPYFTKRKLSDPKTDKLIKRYRLIINIIGILIKEKVIVEESFKNNGKNINYLIFDKINVWRKKPTLFNKPLKFNTNTLIVYSEHWLDNISLLSDNNGIKGTIKLGYDSIQTLKKMMETPYYICITRLEGVLNIMSEDLNINLSDLETELNKKFEIRCEWSSILKSNGIQDTYLRNNHINRYQKLLKLWNLKSIFDEISTNNYKAKIYLVYKTDFRGRLYSSFSVNPTSYPELRNVMYSDHAIQPKKIMNNNNNIKLMKNISSTLSHYLLSNKLGKKESSEIAWLFLSLGDMDKAGISEISYTDLMDLGMTSFLKINKILEYKESLKKIKYYTLKSNVQDILNKKKDRKNYLISKDAPASVLQILSTMITLKDPADIKNFNVIENFKYYDPYIYYIEKTYNEKMKDKYLNKIEWLKLYNRKTLKKLIMTTQYNAGIRTITTEFISLIEKEKIIVSDSIFNNINEDLEVIVRFIKENTMFNKSILSLLEEIVMKINPHENDEKYKKYWRYINIAGDNIPWVYYKTEKKLLEKLINSKYNEDDINNIRLLKDRYLLKKELLKKNKSLSKLSDLNLKYNLELDKIKEKYPSRRFNTLIDYRTDQYNKIKTINAFGPNMIHSVDAYLMKRSLKTCIFIPIHDCALIGYKEIPLILTAYQEAMTENPLLEIIKELLPEYKEFYAKYKVDSLSVLM